MMGGCCGTDSKRPSMKSIAKTHKLPDTTINAYKKLFNQFDKNRDGRITTAELGLVMKSLGRHYSSATLRDMVQSADKDSSGAIEFDEFVQILVAHPVDEYGEHTDGEVSMTFESFDSDKDGFINAAELRATMVKFGVKLSDKEVNQMIIEADLDKDGLINRKEFKLVCAKWLKMAKTNSSNSAR